MADTDLIVLEEQILDILKELFEVTLNRRITEWNTRRSESFLPTFQHVERRRSIDLTQRLPALFYFFNWASKKIVQNTIERAEYFLEVRLVFDDLRPPCLGFRYAALLKDQLVGGDALDSLCDEVILEEMDYRVSEDEDDGEPSEAEFRIRLVREGYV